MKAKKSMITIALLLAVSSVVAAAQKPKVSNAKLQELSAGSSLKATVDGLAQKQAGPLWIGYRIPTAAKERTLCCFDSVDQFKNSDKCCMGCRMESEKGGSFNGTVSDCSQPEPLPYAFVFLRASAGQIGKVRVYSADCALEFANLPLYWLEDVQPEQSVDLLTGLALAADADNAYGKKGSAHQAVMAIAMHDTPAADAALEKLIQPGQRESLRENVAFWLGVERGKKGVELLRKYVKEDPDDNMRAKGTFAFSQSKEPEALKDLIDMARHDSSPHVRGQAIFWLAQIGSRKEAEQITDAIENDPDTEVKKKAVFALSQMHDDQAVPRLIQLARTNKNPAVRKQAIFWLGQSHDPRALDFLEELLTK
ncbi:MAG TPA: HEAT repeat domain-containing protein [Candidatus Angelobacter sp.]|nr:HEAT repeat domain-containing protein [Candidatus Angelobacter sp.]